MKTLDTEDVKDFFLKIKLPYLPYLKIKLFTNYKVTYNEHLYLPCLKVNYHNYSYVPYDGHLHLPQ